MEQNQLPFELVPSKFHNCSLVTFSEINRALKLCGNKSGLKQALPMAGPPLTR
jgi:hypothetical protein